MEADGELRGVWDGMATGLPSLVEMSGMVGGPPRTLELAPYGYGRPWYPLFVGPAVIESRHERPVLEDGTRDLVVSWDFRFIDGQRRTRVGVRRWFKMLRKRFSERKYR